MENLQPKPSIGRIVHYMTRGSADGKFSSVCRAAIVTEVNGEQIGLAVLHPDGILFARDIPFSEAGAAATWHWPERV